VRCGRQHDPAQKGSRRSFRDWRILAAFDHKQLLAGHAGLEDQYPFHVIP
jgi:hypothetical protein